MTDQQPRVDDVNFHELGQHLIELGESLIQAGAHTSGAEVRRKLEEARAAIELIGEPEHYEDHDRLLSGALRRTLTGLRAFRRDYYEWERIVVEYALRRGLTQREVASLLGVGLSTVNRWAQHPVTYEEG